MKKKLDAIPLTVISDDVSAIESLQSNESVEHSVIDSEKQQTEAVKKLGHGGRRSLRVNSTYISQNNRLSRYKTALATFLPYRSKVTKTINSELPVDSIGCFSNLSFSWVKDYLVLPHNDPMMDSAENRKKYELDITLPYNDSADVNGKRLLGIYKDEKQSHGRHGSMMKVVWNFCKTRVIIASLFYTLSVLCALSAPVIFLKMTLDALDGESLITSNGTTSNGGINNITSIGTNETFSGNTTTLAPPTTLAITTTIEAVIEKATNVSVFKFFQFSFSFYGRFKCVYYMLGFIGCFFGAMFFDSITKWLNLRTSIRLRTAVLSATYRKAIKSSIVNNIAPHQILTDDIDNMMELVDYLTKILGTVIAMILSLVASVLLLSTPGVWPIFACIGFFCIPVILAKISTNRFRKCQHYLLKKITFIESFCANFKDIIVHSLTYEYIKNFYYLNSAQFSALRISNVFSVEIYEGLTSVLLGGLYLIWCDGDIETDKTETLVLVIVYVYFIKNYVSDYCHSIQAISNGKGSLEKLKNSFAMLVNPESSRVRTIDTRVLISMSDCRFSWDDNIRFTLDVSKGEILGVCGKHKKALIYAILGHGECKEGIMRQRGVVGFFSEEPFICIGSVKDNILMGTDFDAKRYYAAVTMTHLNDDVLQTLGTDELPIEMLDLNQQQKQRIALARAIYSDRDIYLFDEPFKNAVFSSNILQLFANIIHNISSDPNKAIIICSTNTQILNICQRVYDTGENKVYSHAEYERISTLSYHENPVHYTFENIKGCSLNALTVYKMPSRFHVQIIHESHSRTSQRGDESTEHLIAKNKYIHNFSIGIINIIFISFFTTLTVLLYLSLIVGFICIVMDGKVAPMLNLVFLGCFVTGFAIELIKKIYVAKLIEIKLKKFHKMIFEKLLNTSLDFLCGTNIADILNWFSITFYTLAQPYTKLIESIIMITLGGLILLLCNFWLTSAVILILIIGQVVSAHYIFEKRLRPTLNYYTLVEYESRKKMLALIINNLRGRDVIQSFEKTSEFCRDFNTVVEDNSTSIFLQKSLKNYVSFTVQILMAINVTVITLMTLLIGEISIYNYLLSILLYYLLMHYVNEAILAYLDWLIMNCRQNLINSEIKNIAKTSQISLLYESTQIGTGTGLSIEFKDVQIKLCGKKVLDIPHLTIEKFDIIGLTGNSSHLITSVLFKLIKPVVGSISIESYDLNVISQDNLSKVIAVVPHDLRIQNITIAEFLNPNNSIPYKSISNKIQEVLPQILKLPNKTSELMQCLSRKEKQLLCLIKATLKPPEPKLVIIEYPDIEIQPIINLFVRREFNTKTVIIIGTNHRHFEACNRIINFDIQNK
ncbi:ATP-binding cassette sub-family C member 12-like isoform X2 [Chironomus tepperi]|uniref:ATP-binding cassette sub-family C member 12-like isoform X2 n=1 Tax=Chironomus tepperi TaxID=113505 RepID=UPI00391F09A9